MGCVRVNGCPLFPELRSTLATWRMVYCDSETQWQECARYKLAAQGKAVPKTLLPNGKDLDDSSRKK